jgi:hypothetical protein
MSQSQAVAVPTKMTREDAEILHALNLLTPDLRSFDVFMLANKVCHDQTILKLGMQLGGDTKIIKRIAVMTTEQKIALRERVLSHA